MVRKVELFQSSKQVSCYIREGTDYVTLRRADYWAQSALYDLGRFEENLAPPLINLDWCVILQKMYKSSTMQDLTELADIVTVLMVRRLHEEEEAQL